MKEFCMRVRMDEEAGRVDIDATNDGFNVFELIAILDLKKDDLIRQAQEPTKFTRTIKTPAGDKDISRKEDTDA